MLRSWCHFYIRQLMEAFRYILPLVFCRQQRICQSLSRLFFTPCTERFWAPTRMLCDVLSRKLYVTTLGFCEASFWFRLYYIHKRHLCSLLTPNFARKRNSVSKNDLTLKRVVLTFRCLVLFKCLLLPFNRLCAYNKLQHTTVCHGARFPCCI